MKFYKAEFQLKKLTLKIMSQLPLEVLDNTWIVSYHQNNGNSVYDILSTVDQLIS